MKPRTRRLLAVAALALATAGGIASTAPAELRAALPAAMLAGGTHFTYWGFSVYDARLWVEPGFVPGSYERHAFALELAYLRDFRGSDITRRSLDEMRRLGATDTQLRAWQTALDGAIPDVRKGDRITGIHQPGVGATFIANGRTTGVVNDPAFGRMFFGIWLSPRTSEPRMRQSLLAQTPAP